MNTALPSGDPFAAILAGNRTWCNARFAQARRQHPALEGSAFGEFLASGVAPVVAAVAAVQPAAAPETGLAAYEIGLELVGQGLAGPQARQPFINAGWQGLLPVAALTVAAAPARVLGAVSNALHSLGRNPAARPQQWIAEMAALAPQTGGEVDTFLKLGQVLAWRAGMAHFRTGALTTLDLLPERLARQAVGAPGEADWPTTRNAFHADPWFAPGEARSGARIAGRAGAFRGFGGLFTRPPQVASDGTQLFVRSGDGCWLLTADAFGATFHRAGLADFDAARPRSSAPRGTRVDQQRRTIAIAGEALPLVLPGPVTTIAATATTLALTTAHSHAILLVALPDAQRAAR